MGKKTGSAQEQAAREERLANVAADLLARPNITQTELGEKYGVSQVQISRDVKTLRERWQKSANIDTGARVAIQDAQYNEVIGAHMPLAQQGKTRNAEVVMQAMAQQAKLLGLNRPEKQEIEAQHIVREYVGIDPGSV